MMSSLKMASLLVKVIVDAAQCQSSPVGDLAHGSGGIALFEEQGIGGFDDGLVGALAFRKRFFRHRFRS